MKAYSLKNLNFINQYHDYILIGDLQLVKTIDFKKISKRPNYREPKTINWKKVRIIYNYE